MTRCFKALRRLISPMRVFYALVVLTLSTWWLYRELTKMHSPVRDAFQYVARHSGLPQSWFDSFYYTIIKTVGPVENAIDEARLRYDMVGVWQDKRLKVTFHSSTQGEVSGGTSVGLPATFTIQLKSEMLWNITTGPEAGRAFLMLVPVRGEPGHVYVAVLHPPHPSTNLILTKVK